MEMETDLNIGSPHNEGFGEVTETSAEIGETGHEGNDTEKNIPVLSTKSSKMSLISGSKVKKEKTESSMFLDKLQKLLSCFYMNAPERLCLTHFLRCAQDLSFCISSHYSAPMPEVPSPTQRANFRCTWQQKRYMEFIQIATDMCVRCEFPGEVVFAYLMELILTAKTSKQTYVSFVRVFRLFIRTFPPCWLDLRQRYINFFRKNLHISKLSTNNDDPIANSNKVFEIIFSLVERTLDDYAEMIANIDKNPDELDSNQNTSLLKIMTPRSLGSSHWNWEDCDGSTYVFSKLKPDARLERLNIVLDLLLQILEIDLTMWLLQYYRKPKEFMFHPEKTPLTIVVFEMTEGVRATAQVTRLFTIFSKGIAMNLSLTHLKIIERLITLVMVASHTGDIENSIMGIRYPCLQSNTKNLIKDFYKTFKSYNTTSLKPFLKVIDLLRIPYVKFEFIDHFLHIFFHTSGMPMSPAKILSDLERDYASKYKLEVEIHNDDEELSREQFFALLLKSFRAYCQMYGLEQVMRCIINNEVIAPLQTVSNSVHRYPNRGRSADVLCLKKMAKDINTWIKQLRMQVRMSRPKIDFPAADICIDKHVLASYRTDLKHCWLLVDIIIKYTQKNKDVDLTEWLDFIKVFKPETIP